MPEMPCGNSRRLQILPQCGAKVTLSKHTKSRGNGTGSVYKRGKVWVAAKTTGYYIDGDGKVKRVVRTKSGFKTKREAQEYLPLLTKEPAVKDRSFKRGIRYAGTPPSQAGASTMGCYSAAMNYFKPVWAQNIATITIDDLQDCMDDCPKGKRTQQNMKRCAACCINTPFPGTWPGSTWRSFSGWAGSLERSGRAFRCMR